MKYTLAVGIFGYFVFMGFLILTPESEEDAKMNAYIRCTKHTDTSDEVCREMIYGKGECN